MQVEASRFYFQLLKGSISNAHKKDVILNDLSITIFFYFSTFDRFKDFLKRLIGRVSQYTTLYVLNEQEIKIPCHVRTNDLARIFQSGKSVKPLPSDSREVEKMLLDVPTYRKETLLALLEKEKTKLKELGAATSHSRATLLREFYHQLGKLLDKDLAFFENMESLEGLSSEQKQDCSRYISSNKTFKKQQTLYDKQCSVMRPLKEEHDYFKALELSQNEELIDQLTPLLINFLQWGHGSFVNLSTQHCQTIFADVSADCHVPFYFGLIRGIERFHPAALETIKSTINGLSKINNKHEAALNGIFKGYYV